VKNKNIPQIISPDGHSISLSAVSDNAVKIVQELKGAGYEAHLVGGCVRDLLLGRTPKDFDIATDAQPEEIKSLFRSCRLIGRRFRLAHVRTNGEIIEVATFRAALSPADDIDDDRIHITDHGQVLRDNVYGTQQDDVLRRDFTINALYFDPQEESVRDFVGGMIDLEKRVIRTIGDPLERLREDPVRMLRAVRFAAKLRFDIDPAVLSATAELAPLLHHVPPARMLDEVIKLFHGGYALRTYEMLREYGLFRYLFPFTEQCLDGVAPNLSSLALANTDTRVQLGKPVIPAFLFACLLWDPLQADVHKLRDGGMDGRRAWGIAAADAVRDQAQHVAIPRRFMIVIKDIWALQPLLEQRSPKSIHRLLTHKRFRAAYDLMLLRTEVKEINPETAQWWTRIQEANQQERESMISGLRVTAPKRGRRRKRKSRAA
jgi:poly(A) polymerase